MTEHIDVPVTRRFNEETPMLLHIAPNDVKTPCPKHAGPRATYIIDGRAHFRVGFGMESGELATTHRTCDDCGCAIGALHEPGCDNEQCPACGQRVTACDCWYGPFRRR